MNTPPTIHPGVARKNRLEARWAIIQAANTYRRTAHRARPFFSVARLQAPVMLGMRQLQQAVCIARRQRLVGPEVLVAAGFRRGAAK